MLVTHSWLYYLHIMASLSTLMHAQRKRIITLEETTFSTIDLETVSVEPYPYLQTRQQAISFNIPFTVWFWCSWHTFCLGLSLHEMAKKKKKIPMWDPFTWTRGETSWRSREVTRNLSSYIELPQSAQHSMCNICLEL
jgi:hypothetical protein